MATVKKFNASALRILLSILLIIMIAVCIAGFYLGQSELSKYAKEVSKKKIDAEASQTRIQGMKNVEKQLAKNQAAMDRASQIAAESQSYKYQDQVITDIKEFATRSGVEIANIDFTPPASNGATAPSAATSSPVTGTSKSASGSATSTAPLTSPGLKSTSVTITLQNPLNFNSYLKFLHYIEQSLTKMQISKLELTKVQDKDKIETINASALSIEVYLK